MATQATKKLNVLYSSFMMPPFRFNNPTNSSKLQRDLGGIWLGCWIRKTDSFPASSPVSYIKSKCIVEGARLSQSKTRQRVETSFCVGRPVLAATRKKSASTD